jgi:uncharacterized protein (DUF433 family)
MHYQRSLPRLDEKSEHRSRPEALQLGYYCEPKLMNLALEREAPPLQQDKTGAIRVGNTRVLLELLIQAFQNGATPEAIVQQYDTLTLSDVYQTIGYYLSHRSIVESYLHDREQLAQQVQTKISQLNPELKRSLT